VISTAGMRDDHNFFGTLHWRVVDKGGDRRQCGDCKRSLPCPEGGGRTEALLVFGLELLLRDCVAADEADRCTGSCD
jgi:hypothetical protein